MTGELLVEVTGGGPAPAFSLRPVAGPSAPARAFMHRSRDGKCKPNRRFRRRLFRRTLAEEGHQLIVTTCR
jgi:hypothetical protein